MSGRPRRPALEARLVREAAAGMDPSAPREAIARAIARRVVEELAAYLDEGDDPMMAALGDLKRRTVPSPFSTLATDPTVDTAGLYVEREVEALRDRCGRRLFNRDARSERARLIASIEVALTGRYLRQIRSNF